MPKERVFHVIPHDGSWAVRRESNGYLHVFETKSQAIDDARKRARELRRGSVVMVHGKSGQIIQSTSAKSSLSEKTLRDAVRNSHQLKRGAVKTVKSATVSHARKR